jgi:hypothetical protein
MGNKDSKNEHKKKENQDSLSSEQKKHVLLQKKKCVCKINVNDNLFGTGFFCKIPFPDNNNLLPFLITNNHVLNENDIENNKTINL